MRATQAFALRELRQAFDHTVKQMQRMHGGCEVKPHDVNVIQSLDGATDISVECRAVVCRVPQRANHGRADLYVAFTGCITFETEKLEGRLVTTRYGTNFAYFVVDDNAASHVMGGHYDFSGGQVAHPRAHLQLRSQADLYPHVQAQFHSTAAVPLGHDRMEHVFTRARPPSAQMDFLSFLLQVCADHLVDERSPPGVVSIFEQLAASCSPVLGYRAATPLSCDCHRSPHWY